ncbi:60S acidic ribosomal protein P2 [Neolecta irregularis DAH-3]|uniref:60S acidic ribosomal protein P2 n=1 Tax=Neolecta irregularis (strain DAH-3) TaxID=1198029 RepID=A0A1U7LLG9_NEOID|nr:60S acidic ribosomal protein P2 [Neolecta irregularis DAH-3]|eukprot:OLL23361.1 60S acidic ribosomal protein P2 [Neolecta irregularis DAH-3]
MRYLAAYLLLSLGGNSSPSAADIKKLLATVGIEADDERLILLLKELKDKDINELVKQGSEKLASVPSGGAFASSSAAPASGGAAANEEKKEEKKAEAEEESDDDMGFGLFD